MQKQKRSGNGKEENKVVFLELTVYKNLFKLLLHQKSLTVKQNANKLLHFYNNSQVSCQNCVTNVLVGISCNRNKTFTQRDSGIFL